MLEDPRVDMEARTNDGRRLEEMVGVCLGNADDKNNCLEMVREERMRWEFFCMVAFMN